MLVLLALVGNALGEHKLWVTSLGGLEEFPNHLLRTDERIYSKCTGFMKGSMLMLSGIPAK